MIAFAAHPDPVVEFFARNIWLVPIAIPISMVAWWCFVGYLVGMISGWSRLAERYRAIVPFEGEKRRFQSARMRYLSNYNNCLTVGVNMQGLYLGTLFLFRVGHTQLLVPWQDISLQQKKEWLGATYELRFAQVPDIYVKVNQRLGEWIKSHSLAGSSVVLAPPPPIG